MHIAERFRLAWHYIKLHKHEALASSSPYRLHIIREGTQIAKQPHNFNPVGECKLSQPRLPLSSLADNPSRCQRAHITVTFTMKMTTAVHLELWSAFNAVSDSTPKVQPTFNTAEEIKISQNVKCEISCYLLGSDIVECGTQIPKF
jgi:hypothetical protein